MVESGGLENRCSLTGSGGSNPPLSVNLLLFVLRRDVRVVEGARLEVVYAERHRGFESPSLRIERVK